MNIFTNEKAIEIVHVGGALAFYPESSKRNGKPPLHISSNKKSNIHHKKHAKSTKLPNTHKITKPHILLSHPQITNPTPQDCVETLLFQVKTTNIEAHKISTKYIQKCVKQALSKYKNHIKRAQEKVNDFFQESRHTSLDYVKDKNNNILTSPEDKALEVCNQ